MEAMKMNRSEINQALAKAIAYKQCGKDQQAACWAARLVYLLECENILSAEHVGEAARLSLAE
jgi:hypothetical protein